jgi:uncharacterized hydrophobic protein (TIGR00271 family)
VNQETRADFHILVAVGEPSQLSPLLTLACMLTQSGGGEATVLCVTPDGACPTWLQVPEQCSALPVTMDVRAGSDTGHVILQVAREVNADLILLGWSGEAGSRRYLLGSTLDPVTRYAPCDIAVLRGDELGEVRRVLIPAEGGPHATRAVALALQLSTDVEVTALNIVREAMGPVGVAAGYEKLRDVLEPWQNDPRVHAKVVRASSIIEGILTEAAAGYDMLLIGGSDESYIERKLFGNVPQTVAAEASVPTIIVRRRAGPVRTLVRQAQRWLAGIKGPITASAQVQAYREVRNGARANTDFYALIALAAAIATLGLQMNSPAVIIGAMIIAPLMSAIFGVSMGVVQGDAQLLLRSIGTTLRGASMAVAIGALISWIVPQDQITPEILGRTQPTLMDLSVALVSGIAGAYAQCRRNVLGAAAGVAIAVALVPPLATVGIGLSIGSGRVAGGALLLFITNLGAITFAGSMVFLFFGFRPDPGRRIRVFARAIVGVLVLLVAISVPLAWLSVNTFRSTNLQENVDKALAAEIGAMDGVALERYAIVADEGKNQALHLDVAVKALRPLSEREAADLQERIAARLRRPVNLVLSVTLITQLRPPSGP